MNISLSYLLNSYPRKRPPLTPAHQAVYVNHHRASRLGLDPVRAAVLKMESWMHRQISAIPVSNMQSILEIGAGSLNHVPYELQWKRYDVIEPFAELYEDSPDRCRVTAIHSDIREVPKENCYDRIISVAVLEHLTDLPEVLALSGLFLGPQGIFQAGIPSEGGLLWGAIWRFTTGLFFRLRTGLSYKCMMRYEHVNNAQEILAILKHFYGLVKIRRFPFPFYHLSFYTYLEAAQPRRDECAAFMSEMAYERK
jgi:hypothetical protein